MDEVLVVKPIVTIDDEVNSVCADVARSILASAELDGRNVVDSKFAQFTRDTIEQAVKDAMRRGTPGVHCYFCGDVTGGIHVCRCGFGESFGCGSSRRYICKACERAHERIARHLREMFAAPRSWRSNSRKHLFERELRYAAKAVASRTGDPDDYEIGDTSCLAHFLAQADGLEQEASEFQRTVCDSFRRSRFLDFKALDRALAKQKDLSLLRSLTRSIRQNLRP